MKKRITGILFSFALLLAMMPVLGISQTAYADEHTVEYLDENGNPSSHVVNGFITDETTSLSAGWYAVESDGLELSGLAIRGDVRIILCDGASLTVEADSGDGITVNGSLTIYAQSKGSAMGKLDVTGNNGIESGEDLEVVGGDVKATGNAAGGCAIRANRDVKISGGSVTASGSTAIFANRNVGIKGGTVTATATGDNGNAISATNYVDLMGGSVTASVTGMGRGIDVNNNVQLGGSVRVWAGSSASDAADVTATFANNHGQKWVQTETATLWVGGIPVTSRNAENILDDAGATASYNYSTETLTLNNYSYESEGHMFGPDEKLYAAIYADQDLSIQLVGKNTVKCTEQEGSAGSGIYSAGKALTISGSGTLTATGYGQSGIGIQTHGKDITINGGTVTASGHNGLSVTKGKIKVNGGIVTVIGNGDKGISSDEDSIVVADKMGINAGGSKETAIAVATEAFAKDHPQQWVQISEAYPLWVRGMQVMVANRDDVLGDGKVSFDPKTNTLKLKGADIKADSRHQYNDAAIYYEDEEKELIIDAAKASTVTGPDAEMGSGIYLQEGNLTSRGSLSVTGAYCGINCFGDNITVNGKLTATGKDIGIYLGSGDVTVNSGADLTAVGNGLAGIAVNDKNGSVTIKRNAKVSAVGGAAGAIDAIVKNEVPGLGWTNPEGTEGKKYLDIDTQGRELGTNIKCAVFPAPAASVTKAPEAKSLTYSGSAQELVTAGKAGDGTMQYALGKDGTTPPESGWSTSVPKGTEAGDYYVWYKAAGDDNHCDSGPACVKVTVAKKTDTAPKTVAAVRGIAKGKTALKFTWNKVKGAASYEIWMSKCNTDKKKYSVKKVKTLGASKTSWTKKKLKKNTAYKFRVVAKDASGRVISKSLIGHAVTGNVCGKYTNAKSLRVKKSSFTLKRGGTAKIKATQSKARKGKKLLDGGHAALLRYRSSDPSVAVVNSKGKITAKGTGNCLIYVQTVNGIWKTVKVSVN